MRISIHVTHFRLGKSEAHCSDLWLWNTSIDIAPEALHCHFDLSNGQHRFFDCVAFMICNTSLERDAIKKTMLAIAQIEVAVKSFWGNIYGRIPKPEIGAVGFTFAESEVRHMDAYAHLLDILGLNDEFKKLTDIPVIKKRVEYLEKVITFSKTGEMREYSQAILLFSLFIEHVSLFSQFLIMMSFNKHKNLFKGISNAVEATSKEEQIHGMFGIDLINIIKKEHPEWFDNACKEMIVKSCQEAYE